MTSPQSIGTLGETLRPGNVMTWKNFGFWRHFRSLGCAALIGAACALPVQAVTITVLGTDYEVVLTGTATTYFAERDDLILAPWFGQPDTVAEQAAADFHAATGGDYGISVGTGDFVLFVYAASGATAGDTFSYHGYNETSGPIGPGTLSSSLLLNSTSAFAYVVPAAVPEIDGNALAKALFILFALGAWLHTRRRRTV
ncbi:MAG: hypothetical protein ACE368_22600 [Paracoccaceae bacterium]